jgi:hypothetical protein
MGLGKETEMVMQKGQQPERRIAQTDIERIWELYFGKQWGLRHIADEYALGQGHVASIIDHESERRWRKLHPHETNRERLPE